MRDFRKLDIWKQAMNLVVDTYRIADSFPEREKYVLRTQVRRCAISIPSNIAEGCRGSKRELNQFLNIALGSSFELETQIEIALRLKYIEENSTKEFLIELNLLQRRMNAFRSKINE